MTISTKHDGGNLSHDVGISENVGRRSWSISDLSRDDKCSAKMRDDEHFEKFDRPRSFSDSSASNVDHGYLKRLRHKIIGQRREPDGLPKTSMKVFVRRETEILGNPGLVNHDALSKDGHHRNDYLGNSQSYVEPSESLLARSLSTGLLLDDEGEPPPKPKLPDNYKLPDSQSKSVDYGTSYSRTTERGGQIWDIQSHLNSGDKDKISDGAKDTTKDGRILQRRQSRLSDSDVSGPRPSVVYRHKDAKLQTELLQKELNQLRSSEHVKKQSEAVKQLLADGRPNVKGNRVRFSGDFTDTSQRLSSGPKTHIDLNTNGAKKIFKQSKSLDHETTVKPKIGGEIFYTSRHNNPKHDIGFHPPIDNAQHSSAQSGRKTAKTIDLAQSLKDDLDKELLEPRRGLALQRSQGQSRSRSESVLNRTSMQRSKSSVGEYGAISADRKNAQISKSASNLRRKYDTITKYTGNYSELEKKRERVRANFERRKTEEQINYDVDDDDLDDVNGSKQHKLKNKFDTIRKYNQQDFEQKRVRVRENYLKNWKKLINQQSDEENDDLMIDRVDNRNNNNIATNRNDVTNNRGNALSKKSDNVSNKEGILNTRHGGAGNKTSYKENNRSQKEISDITLSTVDGTTRDNKKSDLNIDSHTKERNLRPDKLVSDNRSDEEKYAALSKNKILHSKSSSLDSNLQPSKSVDYDSVRSNNENKKFGIMGIKGVAPENTGRLSSDIPSSYSSSSNRGLDRKEPYSDSETIVKGSKANKVESHSKLVVRQCRIGTSVAFGLVGVTPSSITASGVPASEPNGNGFIDGQGLVTIRMIPDEQGRFGFNVKGGADQGMPIIVSRVAPNTPADNAIPRLNEGDQVLYINGRDVSQHTHEQVVLYIRQSRETRSKELILIVRPNAYSAEDNCDEPDLTYDPETHQISSAGGGANALDLSLKLLEESLESGAALAQFEQLYRKKPGMTMNAARLEINIPKNRYRDISPYDQTRVIMKSNPSGDYINANYVNMEIPVSGIVNRYIAAQGPLPTTCTDFWQMIWEQQSTLVVMLTTKVERGRIKCHQYWPDLYETSDYGHLQITCVKEEETSVFAFREFNLTHVESQEERHISHMQYIAWPDHGVPDDPVDFLDFVTKVRQKRVGIVEPVIVHCSAGIGRTGVLITMETAMCLTEANQPVYPLSIVRQMRDQRAMLIQTPNQYKFVCEAIIRAFNEGIVKPLPEYSQR